jgi:hypothetical protein
MAYSINTLYTPAETFSNDLNCSMNQESEHLGAESLNATSNLHEPVRVKDKKMQMTIDQLKIEKDKKCNAVQTFKDINNNGVNDANEKEFTPEENAAIQENER